MADTQEIILEINTQTSIDNIAKLRKEQDALKESNANLQEQLEKNVITYDEYNKAIEKNNSDLRNLNTEYKAQQRVLDGYVASQKQSVNVTNFSANSIKTNRDLLKQLTAQYINLKNPSQAATNQIKQLTDTLKKQEAAIGDTRRNVGNYSEAFGEFANVLKGAGGGLSTAVDGIRSMNAAFIANPILAVVQILVQLFNILQQNAEAADAIKFAFEGLNKGIKVFADLLVEGVKSLSFLLDAFDKPGEAIKNFGELIKENIINRFKAFAVFGKAISQLLKGEFSDAAESAANAWIQLSTGIEGVASRLKDAVVSGRDAARALDQITVSNAKLNSEIRLNEVQIDALTRSLKDKTKEEQERIKIATRIADIEIANANKRAQISREELRAEELRVSGVAKTAEEEKRLIELRTSVQEANAQKSVAIAQKQTRINILLDKEQQEASKEKTSAIQQDYEAAQEASDRALLAKIENDNKSLESDKGYLENREALYRQAERDLIQMADDGAMEKVRRDNQIINNFVGFIQDAFSISSQFISQNTEQAIASLNEQVEQGLISQEQADKESRKLRAEAFQKDKALKITQTVINTAASVMNMLATAPWPVNLIMAAFAAATGIAQSVLIGQQQAPKFASGGGIDIDGKPHSGGGTPIHVNGRYVAEAEKGEGLFIMKKDAYQAGKLSKWNQLFGGKSWGVSAGRHAADGGLLNVPEGDGGFTARESSRNSELSIMMKEAIRNGFAFAPSPKLSLVELETKQASRNRSVSISEA